LRFNQVFTDLVRKDFYSQRQKEEGRRQKGKDCCQVVSAFNLS
jgi:hypothetical protein